MLANKTLPLIGLGMLVALLLSSCSDDSTTDPGGVGGNQETELLDIAQLTALDFSFFADTPVAKSQAGSNYYAARDRVNTLKSKLEAPFERALAAWGHASGVTPTVEAGNPRWDFAYADEDGDLDVSITVEDREGYVLWLMKVNDPDAEPPLVDKDWLDALIFPGSQESFLNVYALDPADDVSRAAASWGTNELGDFINYSLAHQGGVYLGDRTWFRHNGSQRNLYCADQTTDESWNTHWNEAEIVGGLTHPEYNSGTQACWDGNRDNATCVE